jgi:hypothetical protein
MSISLSRRQFAVAAGAGMLAAAAEAAPGSNIPVPGTGLKIEKACDDFEDAEWTYHANGYKSSDEQDHQQRLPAGMSKNRKWFEPVMRGQPDAVKRVDTPKDGIEGSKGALYLASIYPGVPGAPSGKVEQDDFCANCVAAMGGNVSISWQPNTTVRIFVPPQSQWENRNGSSFGYRLGLRASHEKRDKRGRSEGRLEEYWPGMWFKMETSVVNVPAGEGKPAEKKYERYIQITMRANTMGHDINGPKLTETGWYTLGFSCTADGQVHYFLKKGVEDLTAEDRIGSSFPYGFRASQFETYFFDVLALDNGRTWSTPWVIDDPCLYLASPPRNMTARK